ACAAQEKSCEGYVFKIAKVSLDWHGGSYITGQCSVVRTFKMQLEPEKPTVPATLPTAPPVPTLPVALPTLPPTLPPAPTLPPLTLTRRLEPSEHEAESLLFGCAEPVNFRNSTFTSVRPA
ncbi:unnamed protein product, partial [Symbiodinium sp. CCMP2456]